MQDGMMHSSSHTRPNIRIADAARLVTARTGDTCQPARRPPGRRIPARYSMRRRRAICRSRAATAWTGVVTRGQKPPADAASDRTVGVTDHRAFPCAQLSWTASPPEIRTGGSGATPSLPTRPRAPVDETWKSSTLTSPFRGATMLHRSTNQPRELSALIAVPRLSRRARR
jgi:hypothetical protein